MKTLCNNKGLKWCPGAELNHRHADFQSHSIADCTTTYQEKIVKPTSDNQSLSDNLSNSKAAIDVAAEWLSLHRDEVPNPPIPWVKQTFCLDNLGAIEALRRGRSLRFARAL